VSEPGDAVAAARRVPGAAAAGSIDVDYTLRVASVDGGWLFAIAQRKIVDAVRSHPHESATGDELEARIAVWDEPGSDGGVWTEVAALPAKQREAIGLRFLGDLAHADVALVMGTTEEAARRNLFEGLKRLRKDRGR